MEWKKKKAKMFRAVGLIGFIACVIICSCIPALAGENGTLLWWNDQGFRGECIEEVTTDAQEAKVELIISQGGESFPAFLARQDFDSLDAPMVLYWAPGHGSGWSDVGGYTLLEVSAMVEEAKSVLNGQKLDVTLLGPCFAGNIETMSCFAGLTEKVLAYSCLSSISIVTSWLNWLKEKPGENEFDKYAEEFYRGNFDEYGWLQGQFADPERLLDVLAKIRGFSVPVPFFQSLLDDGMDLSVGESDIWNLVDFCNVTNLLRDAAILLAVPEDNYWKGLCYLSCWNGENIGQYLATIPEENRCISGTSAVTPTPTPSSGETGSGGGGGCMVGAQNFPSLLLLLPFMTFMKRGKK